MEALQRSVAATQAQRLAEIPIHDVLTPARDDRAIPIAYRNGTITPLGGQFESMPGFDYAIKTVSP